MNQRERIVAALNHEPPDRTPIFDIIRNTAVVEYFGGERLTHENAEELVVRAAASFLDGTRHPDPPYRPGRFAYENGFVYERKMWTQWLIERPFNTFEGMLAFAERDIAEFRARRFSAAEVAEVRRKHGRQSGLSGGLQVMVLAVDDGVNAIYTRIGLELFSYLLAENPRLVETWIQAIYDRCLRAVTAFGDPELCPFAFIYSDIAFKGATIFSPRYLRESGYFRRITGLCRACHDMGLKVIYHSDGNIMAILGDLVEAGCDAINPVEVTAGMDIKRIVDEFGGRLALVGGIDCSQLLANGTPAEVSQATRDLIDLAGRRGGLLVGSTTELHDAIPVENVVAMVETARGYRPW